MNADVHASRLLLLHGFTGGPESWRGVRSHLASLWSQADVLTPYLAGHGEHPESQCSSWGHHSFEEEVDRLARMCASNDGPPKATVLVGYSLGARIGLGLVVKHPNLFRRAVLVGVNPGLDNSDARRARAEQDEELARCAEQEGLEPFLRNWEALPLFATQTELPPAILLEQTQIRRRNTAHGLAFSLRTCGLGRMPNYNQYLHNVDVPIQLVAGERDERFVGLARAMSSVLPRASVHVIPGCGHNVPLEAPAALAALIQTSQ